AMDYIACERHCVEALAIARQRKDWAYFARILLPLQEARRQRRIIAAEGAIRLGTGDLNAEPTSWLEHHKTGCLLVSRPHLKDDARCVLRAARDAGLFVEVMYLDNDPVLAVWSIRSFQGAEVEVPITAPP